MRILSTHTHDVSNNGWTHNCDTTIRISHRTLFSDLRPTDRHAFETKYGDAEKRKEGTRSHSVPMASRVGFTLHILSQRCRLIQGVGNTFRLLRTPD